MVPSRMPALLATLALATATRAGETAAEASRPVVATFTRQVQPLILNRCAAGACHGGPTGHAPRFERGPVSGQLDRDQTLANMRTFLAAIGSDRDPHRLVTMLAGGHPETPRRAAPPLSARERIAVESWLATVRAVESGRRVDPAVRQVAASVAPTPAPNRLRAVLDAATTPPDLEPPEEPRGAIFRMDDGSTPEPPLPPEPPAPSP